MTENLENEIYNLCKNLITPWKPTMKDKGKNYFYDISMQLLNIII